MPAIILGPFSTYWPGKKGRIKFKTSDSHPTMPRSTLALDPSRILRVYKAPGRHTSEYYVIYETENVDYYASACPCEKPPGESLDKLVYERVRGECREEVADWECPQVCVEDPYYDPACTDYVEIRREEQELWSRPDKPVPNVLKIDPVESAIKTGHVTRRNAKRIVEALATWDMITVGSSEAEKTIEEFDAGPITVRLVRRLRLYYYDDMEPFYSAEYAVEALFPGGVVIERAVRGFKTEEGARAFYNMLKEKLQPLREAEESRAERVRAIVLGPFKVENGRLLALRDSHHPTEEPPSRIRGGIVRAYKDRAGLYYVAYAGPRDALIEAFATKLPPDAVEVQEIPGVWRKPEKKYEVVIETVDPLDAIIRESLITENNFEWVMERLFGVDKRRGLPAGILVGMLGSTRLKRVRLACCEVALYRSAGYVVVARRGAKIVSWRFDREADAVRFLDEIVRKLKPVSETILQKIAVPEWADGFVVIDGEVYPVKRSRYGRGYYFSRNWKPIPAPLGLNKKTRMLVTRSMEVYQEYEEREGDRYTSINIRVG